MIPARINLVRVQPLKTSEALTASGTGYDYPDEVELLTPAGNAAAMVTGAGYASSDITYEYSDGSLGSAVRRMRHTIALNIDFIGDGLRAKLEKWMRARALLHYCPGYGRYTDFAWRPLAGRGSTYRDGSTSLLDLTGRYAMASYGSAWPVWDADLQVMRPFSGTNPRRTIPTPAGSGMVADRGRTNRFTPPYPGSAVEGNDPPVVLPPDPGGSGWSKSGTHSADLTFTHSPNGFGHSQCPDSLIVDAASDTSRDRKVIAQTLWDSGDANYQGYEFTGSQVGTVSVWLRGRVGIGATISFRLGITDADTVDLDELDMEEWTKVSLSIQPADWSTAVPIIVIDLSTGAAAGGNARLEIGPVVVCHNSASSVSRQPEWSGTTAAVVDQYTVTSYAWPTAGSVMASFWVPEDADPSQGCYLVSPTNLAGSIRVIGTTAHFYRTNSDSVSGTVTLVPGAVNTLCATWPSHGLITLYHNGVKIADSGAGYIMSTATVPSNLNIRAAWPLIPLTCRIDRRTWTADEVAEYDTALRDPGCNLLAVHARGRAYRLVEIPSIPRNQQGGTVWVGDIVLEEYEYDHNLADVTSEEPI